MKLLYDDKEYDLSKALKIEVVKREYYKHHEQSIYLFRIDFGDLTKKKEKMYTYVGMFPDHAEIKKVQRTIDYFADKRKNSETVIPVPEYKNLFKYLDDKHDTKIDISYKEWSEFYESK